MVEISMLKGEISTQTLGSSGTAEGLGGEMDSNKRGDAWGSQRKVMPDSLVLLLRAAGIYRI